MEINKRKLRKTMSCLRDELSEDQIQEWSDRIFECIRKHPMYLDAACIFSYVSFRSEVYTWNFNRQILKDGKILAVPKVLEDGKMKFFQVDDLSQLKKGYMGIFEPDASCPEIDFREKALMIVPGLAFDRKFGRLGYGGGYYDRYMEKHSDQLKLCAVAFGCQVISEVPRDMHDFLMEYIVTENECLERIVPNDIRDSGNSGKKS